MRLVPVLLAAAALAAVAVWLVADAPAPGPAGAYPVEVVGPDGTILQTTVHAAEATALGVLLAAAQQEDVDVVVTTYTGYGCGAYVESIAGYAGGRAGTGGGWTYQVGGPSRPDGRQWEYPTQSAACAPVPAGGAVRWLWTDGVG